MVACQPMSSAMTSFNSGGGDCSSGSPLSCAQTISTMQAKAVADKTLTVSRITSAGD